MYVYTNASIHMENRKWIPSVRGKENKKMASPMQKKSKNPWRGEKDEKGGVPSAIAFRGRRVFQAGKNSETSDRSSSY